MSDVTDDVLKGRLLVATPNLGDPNFERTVVLILEHGPEGALGVVLNRPSDLDLAEPLPEWARAAAHPPVVFIGGPVAPSAAVCLARLGGAAGGASGFEPLLGPSGPLNGQPGPSGARDGMTGPLGTLDLDSDPDEAIPRLDEIRVFAGYAGWGPDQLEVEIEAGGWFVVDADATDPLSPAPEDLWATVLRRQRGTLALFAAYPSDPSLN
jgi:putative transcriptional regulator